MTRPERWARRRTSSRRSWSRTSITLAHDNPAAGARGVSLLVVETAGCKGFARGRTLDKIGMHGQDTAELVFDGVRVPSENLLGTEGHGCSAAMAT